jgi:chromosome segregation ATPase
MMLVSLSALSQYPTTKKIKGEQVVIMTVKQAEAINNKFQSLEDSIAQLKASIDGCATSLNFTKNKLETATNSIVVANDSIIRLNTIYDKEVKRQDKLEWIDKYARKRVTIGVGAAILTWLAFILVTIKH